MQRAGTSLFLSLVLHGLLLAVFFVGIQLEYLQTNPSAEVEIQIVENSELDPGLGDSGQEGGKENAAFNLDDFMRSSANEAKKNWNKFLDPNGKVEVGDNEHSEWGSGGNEFGRIRDYMLMKSIYEQVDGMLGYPNILSRSNITGVVNARLVFDDKGQCNWRNTQISSTSSPLRVYILSVLKKTCGMQLPNLAVKRPKLNVDLSFEFITTHHNEKKYLDERKLIVGNVLMFSRNYYLAHIDLGPIDIVPTPLMIFFNVDFQELKLYWDKYVEDKDPLAPFRES